MEEDEQYISIDSDGTIPFDDELTTNDFLGVTFAADIDPLRGLITLESAVSTRWGELVRLAVLAELPLPETHVSTEHVMQVAAQTLAAAGWTIVGKPLWLGDIVYAGIEPIQRTES